MSKLTRQTLQQFGATVNVASEIGEFGSGATGSPVYTGTLSVIQSLAAWSRGWAAETIANNRPFLEDMNAVDYVFGYELCYILQMGVPEYDAGTTYFTNSMVQYGGIVYQSLVDNNAGNTPAIGSNWTQFTNKVPYVKCTEVQAAGTNGQTPYNVSTWTTCVLNTKDNDTAGIATLGSNLITLPAGTYQINAFVPLYAVNAGLTRLYNVTASSVLIGGTSERTPNNLVLQVKSFVVGQFTLAATSQIAIQYIASQAGGSIGGGTNLGISEVFTTVEINKIS